MKLPLIVALAGLAIGGQSAAAQTFDRNNRLIVAPAAENVAASQVAVAQAQLAGSVLVSYRSALAEGAAARIVVATRVERMIVDIDPETFEARVIARQLTNRALPHGILVCRSYAPVDAILSSMSQKRGRGAIEILPPHRPQDSWRVRTGGRTLAARLDAGGAAVLRTVIR